MKISVVLLHILMFTACNSGPLKTLANLPKTLEEVSGTEKTSKSKLIWMLNDSGNKPVLYGLNKKGNIKQTVKVKAKNNDWEDLTTDQDGNLYIGDFGNNHNNRKNLAILKIKASDLNQKKANNIEYIHFSYEDQNKFPPKANEMYFDCEAFFYLKNNLYLFTKSRVHNKHGKTTVYKLPAKGGRYIAKRIGSFFTGEGLENWTTAIDISDDETKIALLTPKAAWVFSNFKADYFFNAPYKIYEFNNSSQKEGICFKNNNTLYITDEKSHGNGGNLYELKID